jgi:hypothetical protein
MMPSLALRTAKLTGRRSPLQLIHLITLRSACSGMLCVKLKVETDRLIYIFPNRSTLSAWTADRLKQNLQKFNMLIVKTPRQAILNVLSHGGNPKKR